MSIATDLQAEKDRALRRMRNEWETVEDLDQVVVIWNVKEEKPVPPDNVQFLKIKNVPAGYRYALLPGVGYAYIRKLTKSSECYYKDITKLRWEMRNIEDDVYNKALPKLEGSLNSYLRDKYTKEGPILIENLKIGKCSVTALLDISKKDSLTWSKNKNLTIRGRVYFPDTIKKSGVTGKVFVNAKYYYGGPFETGLFNMSEVDPDSNNDEIWEGLVRDILTQGLNRYTTVKVIPETKQQNKKGI